MGISTICCCAAVGPGLARGWCAGCWRRRCFTAGENHGKTMGKPWEKPKKNRCSMKKNSIFHEKNRCSMINWWAGEIWRSYEPKFEISVELIWVLRWLYWRKTGVEQRIFGCQGNRGSCILDIVDAGGVFSYWVFEITAFSQGEIVQRDMLVPKSKPPTVKPPDIPR